MKWLLRCSILIVGLIFFWQGLIFLFQFPPYILPTPYQVFVTWHTHASLIFSEGMITFFETLIGLVLGTMIGCVAAIMMIIFSSVSFWLRPLLVLSQAIPTFALAPLLVIWFGFGMGSKIVMTILMLFFPITTAFYDGLKRTNPEWIHLANTMRATPSLIFWRIRIPAALPSLASGLRVASAIAPLSAVVGEWVGASKGLGFLMLNANARMQIDLLFAALFTLIVFSILFYFLIDKLLQTVIYWE